MYLEGLEIDESNPAERRTIYGMQAVGPEEKEGPFRPFPQLEIPPSSIVYADGRMVTRLPFVARYQRTMSADGELIYGVPTDYRYTVEAANGAKTIVERRVDPVLLRDEEREAQEQFTTSRLRSRDPGWTWDGPEIPYQKPAYEALYPAQDGRLLVQRKGEGIETDLPSCVTDPSPEDFVEAQAENRALVSCWQEPLIWDMFEADGRYLGRVDLPDSTIVADPFLDGETMLLAVEDDAGTIIVKRYRLVLPGE